MYFCAQVFLRSSAVLSAKQGPAPELKILPPISIMLGRSDPQADTTQYTTEHQFAPQQVA